MAITYGPSGQPAASTFNYDALVAASLANYRKTLVDLFTAPLGLPGLPFPNLPVFFGSCVSIFALPCRCHALLTMIFNFFSTSCK